MGTFPKDFPVPKDEGGPGKGELIGGFGGNPDKDKQHHRNVVKEKGKTPVILIHGHAGSADIPGDQWDMLDQKRMLVNARYPDELIWAPSYLSTDPNWWNRTDWNYPHTDNIGEVRKFIDNVCEYLNVDVVDFIAHSLGCSMVYSYMKGLKADPTNHKVIWSDDLKRWHKVGTFVASAVFTITKEFEKTVFVNDKDKDGYIKGNPDGSGRSVGAFSNLAIGVSPDGKINRAILHFDTSSLPDNATITRAFLQVKYFSGMHDPWAENKLVADVKRGYFGTSNALQTDDWDSKPTAEAVCTIDKFTSGTMQSSDFTKEGLQAINMTGITQLRLRFDPNPSKKLHYIYIAQGDDAKLFIEYTV
jgi:pimeloyl-ACP methyl ester carboxylesterase